MRIRFASVTLLLAFGLGLSSAYAGDTLMLPEKKQTKLGLYMSARDAFEAKQSKGDQVVFVDVRTPEEVEFVGAPTLVDANIPYMKADYSEWDDKKNVYAMNPNSRFLVAIEELLQKRGLGKDATVVLMCRSGDRSANAANLMAQAGYTHVYSIYEGFEGDMAKEGDNKGKRMVNGWKNAQLPWGYSMNKDKAYFE